MNKGGFFLFFIFSLLSFSQDSEWELWSKMEYRYKINKKSFISLEPGSRYDLNPILFSKQFIDLSSSRKIKKTLTLEVGLRLTKTPNQKLLGQRLYFSILYKPDFRKYKFSFRSRLFSEKSVNDFTRQYFRNKIMLGYKQSLLLNPYLEAEFLCGMNNLSENKSRFGIGNQFNISKSVDLKIFFRLQNKDQKIIGLYISKKV